MSDQELDDFFSDVVAGVDDDIASDGAMPDIAAVVARAHQLDPTRVSAEAVEEVASWGPVVPLAHVRRMRDTRDDPDFQAIVAEVRAHVDQEVAAGLGGETRRTAAANESPATGYRVWIGVFAAAAALVLVTIGVMQLGPEFKTAVTEPPTAEAAFDEALNPPPALNPVAFRRPGAAVDEPEPLPEPELVAEELEEPPRERRKRRAKAKVKAPEAAPAPSKEDRIRELNRLAHAAWDAGQRDKAASLFREVIALDGRGRYADLAYGDLFTLATQRKKPKAKLWREYLKRFPRGRYSDDARHGLCQRMEGDARTTCWEDYLRDMPNGAFRATALKELERARAGK